MGSIQGGHKLVSEWYVTPSSRQPYFLSLGRVVDHTTGQLNQNELSERIDHFIAGDPSILHLHNQFICALLGNATRDLPEQGVAPWVSANDKPVVLSKPVSGNAAEQRLKTEVMQLPARDRRRLKEIPDVSTEMV